MKKIALLLAALFTLGLLCTTPVIASQEEPVTLRFLWWGGDSRHEATLAALQKYMELNPHVTIEAEFQGFDGYEEKLATQIAGGTAPDLVQITSFRMIEFGTKNDIFVNLNDYLGEIDISGFDPTFLDNFCVVDGKLLGLPTGLNAHNIVMNQNVYEAAGMNLQEIYTWEDFITEGKKVNEHNPEQYFYSTDRDGWYLLLRSFVRQHTGNWLVNDDYSIGATRESLVDAYEFLQRCYTEKVVEPTETAYQYTGKSHENKKYLSGDLGAMYMNSSSYGQFRNDNVVFMPRLIPIMEGAKANGIVVQPSQCFSVTKGKNVEETVKLLNFLFNDEEAIMTLKSERGTPATSNGRALLAEKGLLDEDVSAAVAMNLAQGTEPVNQISEETLIKRVIMDISEELSFFRLTPEEAADRTLQEFEDTLMDMGLR